MTLHRSSGRWQLGLVLSLLTTLLWGIVPIALAFVTQALDVYTITWFRFLLSFALVACYLIVRSMSYRARTLRSFPFRLKSGLRLLVIAVIAIGIHYLLYIEGLVRTSPTNVEVLIQLAPVLMGLGAILAGRQKRL